MTNGVRCRWRSPDRSARSSSVIGARVRSRVRCACARWTSSFATRAAFPKLEDLLAYHCVILDDVPRKDLPDAALEALEAYVKKFGGGVLMTGGPRSFGDKAYQRSAVERILPVSLVEQQPKGRGRAPMGIFLVIDRSNSMGYNSRQHDVRDGEKMRYAREAALALVEQLRPEDRVGVIAFDSDPYVLGPLRPLSEQRATLEDRIGRLVPGGGTDFKAALEIATAQLVQSGLKTLHIILMTDGDTNRGAADHAAVIQAMARLGITVSTIRIGDDDVNLDVSAADLPRHGRAVLPRRKHRDPTAAHRQRYAPSARRGGGGREARRGERTQAASETLRPVVGDATEVLRGLADREFPPVRDVPMTKLKSGADLVLYVDDQGRKQPLLATWLYGLGRAAAFPFDPAQPEASGWAAWPGYAKLWSQLVRWAIREEAPWETRQAVRFRDGSPFLEVQTFDDIGEGDIQVQIFTSAEHSVSLSLTPVRPAHLSRAAAAARGGQVCIVADATRGRPRARPEARRAHGRCGIGRPGSAELARKLPDLELLARDRGRYRTVPSIHRSTSYWLGTGPAAPSFMGSTGCCCHSPCCCCSATWRCECDLKRSIDRAYGPR